jgi:hypothetical protein
VSVCVRVKGTLLAGVKGAVPHTLGSHAHLQGIFVAFVHRGSAAALGGMRFGDQILQVG